VVKHLPGAEVLLRNLVANEVEGFARPFSGWVRMLKATGWMGEAASSAGAAAMCGRSPRVIDAAI
jgi:hypothetical protein